MDTEHKSRVFTSFQDFSLFCPALITLWRSTWELCPLTSLHKRWVFSIYSKSGNVICISPVSQHIINKNCRSSSWVISIIIAAFNLADPDQRLSDGVCGWRGVLPHTLPHLICGQRVQCTLIYTAAGSNHPEECTRYQKPGRTAIWQRGHITQYAGEQNLCKSLWGARGQERVGNLTFNDCKMILKAWLNIKSKLICSADPCIS